MESWIRGGLQLSNVTCPCWYEVVPAGLGISLTYHFSREESHFDGFYGTPCTPAAETSGTPTERMAQHQPLPQSPEDIIRHNNTKRQISVNEWQGTLTNLDFLSPL